MKRSQWQNKNQRYIANHHHSVIGSQKNGSVWDWSKVESISEPFISMSSRSGMEVKYGFNIHFISGVKKEVSWDVGSKYKKVPGTFYGTNAIPYDTQDYFKDKAHIKIFTERREVFVKLFKSSINYYARKGR